MEGVYQLPNGAAAGVAHLVAPSVLLRWRSFGLEVVLGHKSQHFLDIWWLRWRKSEIPGWFAHLLEEGLYASGGSDLKHPGWLIPLHLKPVNDPSWLVDKRTRGRGERLIPARHRESPLQDVECLLLLVMNVRWWGKPCW